MKKVLFSLVFSLIITFAYSQSVNSFFSTLESSGDYGVVKVNKEMFQLLAAMDDGLQDSDVQDLINGLNEITILIQESSSPSDYSKFQSMVSGAGMKSYMSFKDDGTDVNLYSTGISDNGKLKGVVLSVNDSDQTIFMNIDGLVDLAALGKLTKDIQIDGLDQLKNLNENKK